MLEIANRRICAIISPRRVGRRIKCISTLATALKELPRRSGARILLMLQRKWMIEGDLQWKVVIQMLPQYLQSLLSLYTYIIANELSQHRLLCLSIIFKAIPTYCHQWPRQWPRIPFANAASCAPLSLKTSRTYHIASSISTTPTSLCRCEFIADAVIAVVQLQAVRQAHKILGILPLQRVTLSCT